MYIVINGKRVEDVTEREYSGETFANLPPLGVDEPSPGAAGRGASSFRFCGMGNVRRTTLPEIDVSLAKARVLEPRGVYGNLGPARVINRFHRRRSPTRESAVINKAAYRRDYYECETLVIRQYYHVGGISLTFLFQLLQSISNSIVIEMKILRPLFNLTRV